MLLLVFKFIVGLYIACFNGSRFVAALPFFRPNVVICVVSMYFDGR